MPASSQATLVRKRALERRGCATEMDAVFGATVAVMAAISAGRH
jgi:hypothetical protein